MTQLIFITLLVPVLWLIALCREAREGTFRRGHLIQARARTRRRLSSWGSTRWSSAKS